ncbi:MAG: MgsA ATPase protein [Acidimicrobiales bacterium]|nr:MgsA ATPase protein [Acidimicrobiales bacterium]
MTDAPEGWTRPIPHYSTDPFVGRVTIHGLATDEVRSSLHKHVRRGRLEQSIRAALELARTDAEHEDMLWNRLRVIAAEDVGLADPNAPAIVYALWQSAMATDHGAYDRLVFAAQAAGYLATAPKDPTPNEIMQLVVHQELAPDIPPEAICIHTRAGQLQGQTMYDWYTTGAQTEHEVEGRDRSWADQLADLYLRLDPPDTAG